MAKKKPQPVNDPSLDKRAEAEFAAGFTPDPAPKAKGKKGKGLLGEIGAGAVGGLENFLNLGANMATLGQLGSKDTKHFGDATWGTGKGRSPMLESLFGKAPDYTPPGPTPDYLSQYLQQFNTGGVDVNALKDYLSSPFGPKGYNPKNPNSVAKTIQQLANQYGWQPNFMGGASAQGGDPLAQQALFSQMIQPFLNNLQSQSQQGIANYSQEVGNINKLNPIAGPNADVLKAMLGQQAATEEAGLGQSERAAATQAVTEPGVATVLDTLRANYINQLNNLTTGGTSTTPAKIQAPTSATKIAAALNPKLKAPA